MKSNLVRFTAKVLLLVMVCQLIVPATRSFALTTGPSQPEVQSFEPVGTTEMVDLFSGDFVYNIPLMDIEGYPVNIAYHSGVNMEQEASWVGLGWNINPGEISRGVRGVPDDFNGDTLIKKLNIKPEQDFRFRFGIEVGFEVFGFAKVGIPVGTSLTYNNYKGVGIITDASVSLGTGHSLPFSSAQLGMGITVGSQTGATVDADASVTFGTSKDMRESNGTISLSGGTGYNSRSGLTDVSLNFKAALKQDPSERYADIGYGFGSSIPIGLQNYVPVITNASTMNAGTFKLDLGFAGEGTFESMSFTLSSSNLSYDPNGSRKAYGYLYEQNANDSAIMDFSREKDGIYNSSMPNLPLSSMTYDIYSITGQGTGGMFRPFRNDIGSVFDPTMGTTSNTNDLNFEAGVGQIFEFGTDYTRYTTKAVSGPWYRKLFKSNNTGSLFENTYFKQAGEMTYSMQQDNATVASHAPVMVTSDNQFHAKGGGTIGAVPDYYGGTLSNRAARANHLSYLSNAESAVTGIGTMPSLESYPRDTFVNNNNASSISIKKSLRSGTKITDDKAGHIGEMTQILPDGRRYVYGLPAINHIQKEVTFAVKNSNANIATGLVKFTDDDKPSNTNGIDNYYQATYTPAYAHSYLLTQVLTPDYTDVTGDGPTEDDLGSYTKINYTHTDADFRWVAPIEASTTVSGSYSAQYNPGFWSDTMDDKGSYTIGSRDNYYVHSIESKNMIAEFYTSPRNDGQSAKKAIINTADITNSGTYASGLATNKNANNTFSYKLDSIVLYNKHDRIANGSNATPIKTVIFKYDYLLCKGVPNYLAGSDNFLASDAPALGKLTLERIYFRYGKSDKSLINPYVFTYSSNNLSFNSATKDRWGNYKPADPSGLTNYEFPYVKQDTTEANLNAPAWNLTGIKLPSGGNLSIQYEADDYSYVQDQRTMEMTKIAGVGSGPVYDPKDVLYEDENKPYDYIYFTRSKGRELPGKTLRQNYLENQSLLYFSFNVDLAAKNRYEHITGYADIDSVGYCSGDTSSNYGYVKVKLASAGGSSNNMMSPITLAALNVGRYYLPQIIYPGYSNGTLTNPLTVLNALRQAAKELFTITGNVNVNFMKKGLSKKFNPVKSWVRLNTPGYTKIGGGSRVRTLKLDDDWVDMASNGSTASYGQNYDYTTLLDNNTKISSGVASYEPLIGGDEIPQHMPVKYTASDGHLMPAIEFDQQEPFGEGLYPSPSVGYSKVTVTSINKDIARSSKSRTVQEFYTAKDFPIQTDFTEKSVPVDKHQYNLVNRYDEVNALQGYVLTMNDMHGKQKAQSNYVIHKSPSTGVETDELITSTKYNYQTQNGKLYNQVKAVRRGSLVKPTYSITNMVLGEEADFSIDNRLRDEDTKNFTVSFNLNTIGFGIFVIPIPTVFFPDTHEESVIKTMVSTKVIQQYGILKSVETVDHGARTLVENELWNSETGQVILTKVNNEYNDPINNLSVPAYWLNDRMGPAYFNSGYEEVFDSVYIDPSGNGYLLNAVNNRNYNLGDELLMKLNNQNYRVWITDMKAPPPLPGVSSTDAGSSCSPASVPVFSPRAIYPSGDGTTFWVPNTQGYRNVYVKVIRPGRRNQVEKTISNTSFAGTYNPASMNDLFGGFTNVLNATANTFTEFATNDEFTLAGPYGFNNYILGRNGNFRDQSSYVYKAPRTYTGNNRNSGYYDFSQQYLYQYFIQPFQPQTDNAACSLEDIILGSGPSTAFWRLEKQETVYSAYGLPVEETDANGIASTAVYGYNHALPVALGSNINYKQLRCLNFEDLLEVQQKNRSTLGIWEFLQPTAVPTSFKQHNGLTYGIPAATSFAANTSVTNAASHSGNYSMLFTGAGKIRIGSPLDYAGVPYCYVSMWVKPVTPGVPSTTNMFIEGFGTTGNPSASQDFTAFTVKTNSIDGWYKLEGKITMSLLANYLNVYLSMPASYYVDDIRFYPDGGNMKSYAYDVATLRLMAELDENNFATFYEYDQEGVLIRVKKESDRGILTVSENRKSSAKHVQ